MNILIHSILKKSSDEQGCFRYPEYRDLNLAMIKTHFFTPEMASSIMFCGKKLQQKQPGENTFKCDLPLPHFARIYQTNTCLASYSGKGCPCSETVMFLYSPLYLERITISRLIKPPSC